jgi:hypothetical protein
VDVAGYTFVFYNITRLGSFGICIDDAPPLLTPVPTSILIHRCFFTTTHGQGVGGLVHEEWRNFYHSRRQGSRNTIDGDLIEQFLDLNEQTMLQVVKHVKDEIAQSSDDTTDDSALIITSKITVESLIQKVEELAAMH